MYVYEDSDIITYKVNFKIKIEEKKNVFHV